MKGNEMIPFVIKLGTPESIDFLYSRKPAMWYTLPRKGEYVMLDHGNEEGSSEEFFEVVDVWHHLQLAIPHICVEVSLTPGDFENFSGHPDWTNDLHEAWKSLS